MMSQHEPICSEDNDMLSRLLYFRQRWSVALINDFAKLQGINVISSCYFCIDQTDAKGDAVKTASPLGIATS